MADPCVADTAYVGLDTAGSPAVLTADLLNPATSGSATMGDDTTHVVTDHNVAHVLTQTDTIDNSAGTGAMGGIVVVALNPIWAGLPDGPVSLIWEASLTINGVLVDQRDTITQALVMNEVVQFSPGCLVGQVVVPAGATRSVVWEVRITNDGASAQWSYRFGGSKMVWSEF